MLEVILVNVKLDLKRLVPYAQTSMSALSGMMLVVNGPCVSTLKEDLSVIARSTLYSVLMERTVKELVSVV
jgi:hypothetical protein